MAYDKMHLSVGSVRCANERRQYGALLMVSGIVAVLAPLATIVSALNLDGLSGDYTNPDAVTFWKYVGLFILLFIGVTALLTGFAETIHDAGNTRSTAWAILITQLAYIPYVSDLVHLGQLATESGPVFWNELDASGEETSREITSIDVKFIGAMGIMGVASYGFAFIGSIAFMQFSLYTFQTAIPEDRNSSYFAGRLSFYSLVLCAAGISQLMLGSYLLTNFDMDEGKLSGGFVHVGVYVVLYPAMSMVIGGLQVINGLWGFARSLDVAHGGPDDILYAFSMAFQWMAMIAVQIIVQMGLLPGAQLAETAAMVAAMMFALCMMPPYLDYKMRNTLQDIPIDYYGCSDEYEHALE